MTTTQFAGPAMRNDASPSVDPAAARPPRLWPAILLVAVFWLLWAVMTVFFSGTFAQFQVSFMSPMALAIGIVFWWLTLSRLPWLARFWGLGWLVVGGVTACSLAHRSMMMGMLMSALPAAITAMVLWLAVTRGAITRTGWIGLAIVSLLSWCYFDLIRLDGITGGLVAERSWRWEPSAEDKFLSWRKGHDAVAAPAATETPAATLVATPADWPEFRGASRDGQVQNVSLNGDWTASPPRRLWQRPVGPGWSSFAVVGNRGYTQEQRGEKEAVLCFDVATGQELWSHEDDARFYDIVAGAGPRDADVPRRQDLFARRQWCYQLS